MVRKQVLLAGISCAVLLGGCANAKSIYRVHGINEKGQTEYVDAKQRAILVNPNMNTEDGDPTYRMCTEPSPDVFSVYAMSLAASASKNSTNNLGANLGMSSVELGATIERTQTINLMRDSLYHTCLRYLNGAIDADTMNIQAARDQRMMVATLAIEQLTGVVKRKPTVLTPSTQATLSQAHGKLVDEYIKDKKAMEDTEKAFTKADTAHKGAKSTYDTLNKIEAGKQEGACDLLEKTPPKETPKPKEMQPTDKEVKTETKTTSTTNPVTGVPMVEEEKTVTETTLPNTSEDLAGGKEKLTKDQCQAAKADAALKKTAQEAAKKSFDTAKTKFETTAKLLENIGKTFHSTSASGSGSGDGGSQSPISQTCPNCIAKAVVDITTLAFDNKTEIIYICKGILKDEQDPATRQVCLTLIQEEMKQKVAQAQVETAKALLEANQAKAEAAELELYINSFYDDPEKSSNDSFDEFWGKMKSPNTSDRVAPENLRRAIQSALQKHPNMLEEYPEIEQARTKQQLEYAFRELTLKYKNALLNQE
jgi:uncharacterized protein (DUF2267 family)